MKNSKRQKSSVIKRTKRIQMILCVFLLAAMILPFIPEGALAAEDTFNSTFGPVELDTVPSTLTGKPGVYIMGDGYAIIWVTSFVGTGWVTYKGANDKTVTVSDMRNGFLRTNDYIHVVKVAESEYQYLINGYTVHSTEVTWHEFATATFGKTCTYSTRLKDTKPSGDQNVRALVLTDIHESESRATGSFNVFSGLGKSADPTLVIFNGDLVHYIDETRLKDIFETMGNTTLGQYPIVYCRGNHELRGIDSTRLLDYFPTKTGELYFDFTYGSLWGVVLDTGEDRPDKHTGQALLSDYSTYLKKEENWLRSLRKPTDTSIKYRLGIQHIPNLETIGRNVVFEQDGKTVKEWYPGVNITDSMKHLDLQFAVAGHVHAYRIYDNALRESSEISGMTEAEVTELMQSGNVTYSQTKTRNEDGKTLQLYEFGGLDVYKDNGTRINFVNSSLNHKTFTAGGDWNGAAFVALDIVNNEARLFAGHSDMSYTDFAVNANGSRYTSDDVKAGNTKYEFGTNGKNSYAVPLASPRNLTPLDPVDYNYPRHNILLPRSLTTSDSGQYYTGGSYAVAGHTNNNIKIIGTPAVIESGGDWYNVVWITDKQSAGYVQLYSDGQRYLFYDEVGGKRRSNDVVHTVKVPKKYLNNNKYLVANCLVTHSGHDVTYASGNYCSSPEYLFEDRSNDKTPNILLYANYKSYTEKVDDMATQLAEKAIDGLSTDFSFVAAVGDLCLQQMGQTRDVAVAGNNEEFRDFFISATNLSGGTKLVVISRGNSECRGFYAPDLIKYIPTVTGEYYYSFNYGDYTFINLDTAEDRPQGDKDDDGRLKTNPLYRSQTTWIDDVLAGKKGDLRENIAVMSHMPLEWIDNEPRYTKNLTLDWGYRLRKGGALINLAGADQEPKLYQGNTTERELFTILNGGFNHLNKKWKDAKGNEHYNYATAASVLLSGEHAYVTFCQVACPDEPTAFYGPYYKSYGNDTIIDDALSTGPKVYDLVTTEEISYTPKQPSHNSYGYTISTPAHLAWLSQQVQKGTDFSGETFTLANDIDLMLYPFTPIGGYVDKDSKEDVYDGSRTDYFNGTFDGNGYKIKNLNILTKKSGNIYYASTGNYSNIGLFGAVKDGTIKNLTVEGGFVKGGWYTGALAGRVESTTTTAATIENCYTNVTVFAPGGTGSGAGRAGGFIGHIANKVEIKKCANFGNVKLTRTDGSVGGFVGSSYNTDSTKSFKIISCFNRGSVYGSNEGGNTAGILSNAVETNGEIQNCYNAAPVLGKNNGGILGAAKSTSNGSLIFNRNFISNIDRDSKTIIRTGAGILTYNSGFNLQIKYEAQSYSSTSAKDCDLSIFGTNVALMSVSGMKNGTRITQLNTPYSGSSTGHYKLPTTEVGIKYNDGYPIHTGDYFYAPNSYSDDPISAGEAEHVNEQFAIGNAGSRENLTDLNDMPANSHMYVLVANATLAESNTVFMNYDGTALAASALNNTVAKINNFIWKLTKNSDGTTFKFASNVKTTSTNKLYNLQINSLGINWTLDSVTGSDNKYKIHIGTNYLNGTTVSTTQTEWYILPILQDRDNTVTFGFSGRSSWEPTGTGKGNAGITSTITSLSRDDNHKVEMNYGKFTIQRDSVFGNNISYIANNSTSCNATVTSPTVVASDSSSQLLDLRCNNGATNNMLWDISLTTNNGLSSTDPYYLTLMGDSGTARSTFRTTKPTYSAGGTIPLSQNFFIVYSLNEDGGYYLLSLTQTDTIKTLSVQNTKDTPASFDRLLVVRDNFTSRARFWIQANKREIEVEVVDAYAEVSNKNGKAEFSDIKPQNSTRFKTSLKYGSRAYFDASRDSKGRIGFKKDSYVSNGYSYVGGTDAYTGDRAPGVTFDNAEFYRYFRPHVYAVTFKYQPGNASATTKPIYLDHTDLIAEAKTDSKFTLKGNFTVTFNTNGGTSVSNQPYNWTIKEFKHGGTTYTKTRGIVDKLNILKYDIIANPDLAVINPVNVEWTDPTLDLTQFKPTRDKHVFYGWAKGESGVVKTISSDSDIITKLTNITNNTTVVNAFWAGADFSGMKEKRTKTLTSDLAIYSNDTKQSGMFSNLLTNGTIEWHRLTVGDNGETVTTNVTGNAGITEADKASEKQLQSDYGIKVADQGSGLKAIFKYSGSEIDLAYSALIPTDILVDALAYDNHQKAIFEYKYVTEPILANAKNQKVELSASNFVISGIENNTTGLTYKVYGVLSNGTEILLFNNKETSLPSYLGEPNGGVSYEGIEFTSYVIYFTNDTASDVVFGNERNNIYFAITVNPRIYKATYDCEKDENGKAKYPGEIQYMPGNSYVSGNRAVDIKDQKYYYDKDFIRVVVNDVGSKKISAGSYITVDGVKIYPTYTTGANIIFDYTNEFDYLIHKTNELDYIQINKNDLVATVTFKDESNVLDLDSININIGPLGAKRYDKDSVKKIRFGTVWYLDDKVSQNKWYRGDEFGSYIIMFKNLLKTTTDNDFYDYIKKTYPSTYSTIVNEWNSYSNGNAITDAKKQEFFKYLTDFIAYWNAQGEAQKLRKIKFGSAATDVPADYYYYRDGQEDFKEGGMSVKNALKAYIEFSAVLSFPENPGALLDRDLVYLPYASYVYEHDYGWYIPEIDRPKNVYQFKAPERIYTYNSLGTTNE